MQQVSGPAISDALARELYRTSGAKEWDVSMAAWRERLGVSVVARFAEEPATPGAVDAFLRSLHVRDLALACACASGHDAAWEHFVREVRPSLYAAARGMVRSDAARELADSLYAQLYGVDARGERRRSLFDYYHGRSRLTTWLRTVLAQRHIDAIRQQARTVSLEDTHVAEPVSDAAPPDPDAHAHLGYVQRALDTALDALEPRDRLRLRLYYGQGLTLARIGRLVGEHEATVSRKLERARTTIRQAIERRLREEHGLPAGTVTSLLEQVAAAPDLDLSHVLAADDG